MRLAPTGLDAKGQPSPRFHEFGDPMYLMWAEAGNVADGADVASWPNLGSVDGDFTAVGSVLSYDASLPALNGKPALDFTGSGRGLYVPGGSVADGRYSTVVAVVYLTEWVSAMRVVSHGVTGSSRRLLYMQNNTWHLYGGGVSASGINNATVVPKAWLLVATFNGSLYGVTFDANGTTYSRSDTGASNGPTVGLTVGSNEFGATANSFEGQIAFAAVYDRNLPAEPGYAGFRQRLAAHYGITLS